MIKTGYNIEDLLNNGMIKFTTCLLNKVVVISNFFILKIMSEAETCILIELKISKSVNEFWKEKCLELYLKHYNVASLTWKKDKK